MRSKLRQIHCFTEKCILLLTLLNLGNIHQYSLFSSPGEIQSGYVSQVMRDQMRKFQMWSQVTKLVCSYWLKPLWGHASIFLVVACRRHGAEEPEISGPECNIAQLRSWQLVRRIGANPLGAGSTLPLQRYRERNPGLASRCESRASPMRPRRTACPLLCQYQ